MAFKIPACNVSAWSIRKPLPAILFAVLVLALGAASFKKLPITLLPNVDAPIVTVVVPAFGVAPGDLETQVTQPIENAISRVDGVKHVISTVSDGVSMTTAMFRLDANPDTALADAKAAVAQIRSSLPSTISDPQVKRVNAVGLGILTYAASSNKLTPEQLSYFVDSVVVQRLKKVNGISQVERIGGVERQVHIAFKPDRLLAYGLTAEDVTQQLRAADKAKPQQSAVDLAKLSALPIHPSKGGDVRLGDLATITSGTATPSRFATLNGQNIVGFSIVRTKGASDVTVAHAVEQALAEIHADHPDVNLKLIDTSVRYTEGNFESAMHTLFEGAALAVVVVFLFLRDLRATVIAAIALPLSIIPAFWAMRMLGFSLNLVSLLAITLATGILVDDAIVEIENIVRHIRMGKTAYQAAMDAAAEIGLAVIAISLTIVAVFAPVSFINNIAGQYFKQFGLTVAAEVIFSLLAARLITPMLAAYFLKPHPRPEVEGALTKRYGKLVEWSVIHRYKTVVIGLLLFAGSILSITTNLVSRDFQPVQDSGRSHLAIELPASAKLADTQHATDEVVAALRKRPEVVSVFVDGGRIAPGTPEVRKAQLTINYVPKADRKLSVLQLQALINKDLDGIAGIQHWFVDDYGARPVARIFTGTDAKAVAKFAHDLADEMRRIPTITNVVATTSVDKQRLQIEPKPDEMAKLGVSNDALSETVRMATFGLTDENFGKAAVDGQDLPIRLGLAQEGQGGDPRALAQLDIPTSKGVAVPLASVADIKMAAGPVSIDRFDRERSATVQADLVGDAALGDVDAALNKLPLIQHLPAGITMRKSAMTESMDDLSSGFEEAMRNGLLMVYVVLVLLFASFLQPVTILFSLPLSIGGAILALLITGRPLSMPVIIGILMLMGIVTKNAIMLVDFSVRAMAKGMERTKALTEAGKKRARPIIMTTIAMVAGMLPSALGLGAGGEFRSPMAIAVIGGLLVSTFLSLLFVPAFFAVMDDLRLAIVRGVSIFLRGKRRNDIDPEAARHPAE